jgi:hypothetical protein
MITAEFQNMWDKETVLDCSTKYKGKENCLTHFMKPVLHLFQNQAKTPPKQRTIGQSP